MKLVRIVLVLAAVCAVSACFHSSGSLIPANVIQKPFAASGSATVTFESAEEPGPVTVNFEAADDGYREGSSFYEFGDLGDGWLIAAERNSDGGRDYAIARLSGNVLKVYRADCSMLLDGERAALGLSMNDDDICNVTSWEQLRQAVGIIIDDGSYVLTRTYVIN